MKRAFLVLLAIVGLAGAAVAQSTVVVNPTTQWGQSLTITGKLELVDGTIALKAKDAVYYAPSLQRLAGFVPAIQEGASVVVTGYAFPVLSKQGYYSLKLTKVTVGGKDYDLSAYVQDKHSKGSKH